MNRRALLKLLAAAALVGCGTRDNSAKDLRVVVAGAGIVGASIAYHLAKMGAVVTVIDKEGPATHASRGTFAWINATWAKQPRSYHAITQEGVANWRELQRMMNIPIRWSGSFEWFEGAERQARLAEQIAEQAEWGEPARMLDTDEFTFLEPKVEFGDTASVAFSGNDGAVDPVVATAALLSAARGMGANIKFPCKLTGVSNGPSGLTEIATSLGTIAADKLVLATGAAPEAGRRFAGVDIPQRSTPGVIAITAPTAPILNRVVAAPGIHMHQRGDGRIVVGEQAGAPENEAHALRLAGRPNDFPSRTLADEHGERMMTIAKQFLPAIANTRIEDVYIGWRPLPVDGHPVLGASPVRPDVYLAVMHSGVSLAPIVGQLAAYELLEGVTVDRLDDYRPDRQFDTIKRY